MAADWTRPLARPLALRSGEELVTLRCYLPLYIFCGRHLLAAKLRRSNIDASAGAEDEIARIVCQIRARWPRVRILLRADSGFAREALMAWCEHNRVDFVFGLARNPRLVEGIAVELIQAEAEAEGMGKPARRYTLPSASPALNPMERIWLYLRERYLSHRVLDDSGAVLDATCRAWKRLLKEKGRLASLTAYPYLIASRIL